VTLRRSPFAGGTDSQSHKRVFAYLRFCVQWGVRKTKVEKRSEASNSTCPNDAHNGYSGDFGEESE